MVRAQLALLEAKKHVCLACSPAVQMAVCHKTVEQAAGWSLVLLIGKPCIHRLIGDSLTQVRLATHP